jgi:DNA invertase Pin-like site-specific DNA recombinase
MVIGYIRVSKDDQNEALQLDAMRREGVTHFFVEKISGASKHRPEFEAMKRALRPGDVLVVWDIDRLGRDRIELLQTADWLNQQGVQFRSISQPLVDTTTEHGELVFGLFAVFADYERKKIIRRTKAGLEAARARGRKGGRKPGLSQRYADIAPMVRRAHASGDTIRAIMKAFRIPSTSTVYAILNAPD